MIGTRFGPHNARIPTEREAGIAGIGGAWYCRQLLERDGKNQRTAFFYIADNGDAFMSHDFRGKKTRTVRGIPSAMKPSAPRVAKGGTNCGNARGRMEGNC